MALRMMSAIVPGAHNLSDGGPAPVDYAAERQQLQQELLAAAKQCHARFGGKTELATESDACVTQLCRAFERIFGHGLKTGKPDKLNLALRHVSELVKSAASPKDDGCAAFWPCVREQLTWHEQERFAVLRKVQSERGRGRAWLRAALNERALERHLHSLLAEPASRLEAHYLDWAFLRDPERAPLLPNVAAGLTTILFALRIDRPELDEAWERAGRAVPSGQEEPIISCSLPERGAARRKVQAHVISFDDDEEDGLDDRFGCAAAASAPRRSPDVMIDWEESGGAAQFEEERLLTPLTDTENMGGLVPVSPLDDALDDVLVSLPGYLEDGESTEAAVEATEPLVNPTSSDAETLDPESLRLRLVAMNEVLEQAREDAISSKLQLSRFQRQQQNYLEKHELQIQTLNRENELLRQQLRKYVTAVQMLKKGSDTSSVAEEDSSLDYHKESQEYQNKLVQVAEMHAELMEFNARLTMQLTNKNRLVKMLRAELESLRGPINEEDMPTEAPCLIHIWIPSAFLTGQPSDIHHVYQIYVRIRDTEWNIYRRYAQFHSLYRELKKHDTIVTSFEFPPKKTIGNKDAKFVEERRQKLQQWLRRIVNRLSHCSPAFSSRPTKQTLITLIPFFGDFPNNEEANRSTSRNAYSSSPQYMGL